ncbi:MAG: 4-demethylwyosine synthase TYW1 [Candidatus Hadarchaeota archaeon]
MAAFSPEIPKLERSGYRVVGESGHSAVKVCHWTKKSLLGEGACYKEQFYTSELGIKSHRCLQLTPSLPFCDHRCVFCWRNTDMTMPSWSGGADDPAEILDGAISAQRLLLSGFGGNPAVDKQKFKEAQNPKQCAISLAGEPTIYPKINEMIMECEKRRMTSFLVTNGQHPEVLEKIVEPTQIYISLVAPDEATYERTCRPVAGGWEKLNRSLELMPSFSCRKAVRLTLAKGLNMENPAGYAKLVEKTGCDFLEVKGYIWVGFSRKRLKMENMPLHQEVMAFAEKLAGEVGYRMANDSEPSRVALLKR